MVRDSYDWKIILFRRLGHSLCTEIIATVSPSVPACIRLFIIASRAIAKLASRKFTPLFWNTFIGTYNATPNDDTNDLGKVNSAPKSILSITTMMSNSMFNFQSFRDVTTYPFRTDAYRPNP